MEQGTKVTTIASAIKEFLDVVRLARSQNTALTYGKAYDLTFYISRSYDANYYNNAGTNKVGARFSTVSYSINDPVPIV